jgi:hypothetical protein
MFERNPADMTRTLGEMYKAAFNRSNSNQAAAKKNSLNTPPRTNDLSHMICTASRIVWCNAGNRARGST